MIFRIWVDTSPVKSSKCTPPFEQRADFHLRIGSIKKKEIFLFEEENDAYELLEHAFFVRYKNLGRNDKCACGSDKKFKRCHLPAYQRIQSVMSTFGRSDRENMMDFFIYGITTIEQPIDKWSGFSKPKDQTDS